MERRFEEKNGLGNIEVGFVYGGDFHKGGIFLEHREDPRGGFSILGMIPFHKNQLGTPSFGLLDRHPCPDSIGPRFVGGRGHNTPRERPTDRSRFSPKRGIISLLYRDKKSVHVNVKDDAIIHGHGVIESLSH
jgi:hypothetical protein